MSADTTVVIAAYRRSPGSELAYTAAVVQAADNIHCAFDVAFCLRWAQACFIENNPVWFTGKGGLSRAKQFANLLAQEERENGILEYEDRPVIEIAADRIHILSRKGKRLPQPELATDDEAFDRAMADYVHRGPSTRGSVPDSSRYARR